MYRIATLVFLMLASTLLYAAQEAPGTSVADEEIIPLPDTQLFLPLQADPKEPRFYVSALNVSSDIQDTTVAAVGFGENFGIMRRGSNPNRGWQVGISAAVFAQFDLETSDDLMNADYIIGIPVTWRHDDWSGRVRLYHQSSHLGDEYLLRVQPERVNLSFESLEVILAHDFSSLRIYGGGEYLLRHEPSDLAEGLFHVGLDWRDNEPAFHFSNLASARWVAGVDVKRWIQNDWATQYSVKAGLEFSPLRKGNNSTRRWSLLAEFYDGASPYGQFYEDDLRYLGLAIQLGL